jgi:hypothetical protein
MHVKTRNVSLMMHGVELSMGPLVINDTHSGCRIDYISIDRIAHTSTSYTTRVTIYPVQRHFGIRDGCLLLLPQSIVGTLTHACEPLVEPVVAVATHELLAFRVALFGDGHSLAIEQILVFAAVVGVLLLGLLLDRVALYRKP